jgi:hypothetical protein
LLDSPELLLGPDQEQKVSEGHQTSRRDCNSQRLSGHTGVCFDKELVEAVWVWEQRWQVKLDKAPDAMGCQTPLRTIVKLSEQRLIQAREVQVSDVSLPKE